MKYIILFSILSLSALILFSQNTEFVIAQNTNTLKPFLSEIRTPTVKIEHGFLNKLDGNYFVPDYNHRPFVETNLGVDIPLISYCNLSEKIKFVSTAYVGMNVLVDLYGPPTAAVINTDYFMGFRTGILKYTEHPFIQNIGASIIPIFHESSHLGDEYSLHGYQLIPDFKRINLSHESWEIAFIINDPDTIQTNLLSLKAGIQGLWNVTDGYYFADSLEVKGSHVPNSKNNLEFFINFNMQRTNGFMCSPKWKNIFSIEARNRTKFSYNEKFPEIRTWNFNMYLGWLYRRNMNSNNLGLFLRYYNGIIPHGQLRNTNGFHFFGLSLVYY